ncbi:MAG: PilZ domain-containing protein [Phycisphaerales bacterium]|nr:PilZ domain-containing protein [Phycisphaerales bacterium]
MFDELDSALSRDAQQDALHTLQELERNTSDEIRQLRSSFRIELRAKIILQPGNASDTLTLKMQGVTGDLSQGGCRALFPLPVKVGDIYRLSFDQQEVDLPTTYARCMRCTLVREDAFEAGFKFFAPITVPERLAARAG